ncbi:unnamed protein product [Closterium sp. NIES-54]
MFKFISNGFSSPRGKTSSGFSSPRGKPKGSRLSGFDGSGGSGLIAFSYKELSAATNKFQSSRVLGEGSFGKVYRGKVSGVGAEDWQEDSNGDDSKADATNADCDKGDGGKAKGSKADSKMEVAIKVLHEESVQGMTEWMAELLLLGRLKHPNLVNLIGYCSQKNQAMLVYALMPHGGLDTWLLQDSPRPVLTWQQRIQIAVGAAQGLAYLHGSNIIHRDLKSCNILLDQVRIPEVLDNQVCLLNWVGSGVCVLLGPAGISRGQQRIQIAVGAPQGLAYLHGWNIIHRDLKSFNILLDQVRIPQVLDSKHEMRLGSYWSQLGAGQAAQGLAYLHGSNIIHRDLKSCNILNTCKRHSHLSGNAVELLHQHPNLPPRLLLALPHPLHLHHQSLHLPLSCPHSLPLRCLFESLALPAPPAPPSSSEVAFRVAPSICTASLT